MAGMKERENRGLGSLATIISCYSSIKFNEKDKKATRLNVNLSETSENRFRTSHQLD